MFDQQREILEDSGGLRWIMGKWGAEDPLEGLNWLRAGRYNSSAFNSLMGGWSANNPEEAMIYLLENGNEREITDGISAVARVWAEQNLEAAMDWTNQLPDSENRDRAMLQVVKQWLKDDSVTATEWIRESEMDLDQRVEFYTEWLKGTPPNERGVVVTALEKDPKISDLQREDILNRW